MPRLPKPTRDFPLFAHAGGQWAKKIEGKLRYFGVWADPSAALDKYQESLSVPPEKKIVKSAKPKKDFPLYLHQSGNWAKKVNGRTRYFGKDAQVALENWLDQKGDLLAGREPRVLDGRLTVFGLVNACLAAKEAAVANGEMTQRCWEDYHKIGEVLFKTFGKDRSVADLRPDDFARLKAEFNTVSRFVLRVDFRKSSLFSRRVNKR